MEAGGSERQLLYLAQGLDRSRFQPVLYLTYEQGSLLRDLPKDVEVFSFWRDRSPPRWNWPGRIHGRQVQHLLDLLKSQRIDLVYDRLFHMTLITGPATKRADVPRVSAIVSPPEFDLERTEKRWRWWKRRALARAYRSSRELITVSQGTAESASRYYAIPLQQFLVVPSPVDLNRIERLADEESAIDRLKPNANHSDCKHLLAVGRLSEEKGHRDLIMATALYLRDHRAKGLPAIHLHIAGDGPLRKDLEELLRELDVDSQVTLHGQVDNPYAMMRGSDLFVMPSHYEGMPNAMLEAMACGAPVLATNTQSGPGELLRHHPLGKLVPVSDPGEMCRAIEDRFEHESEWISRALQARTYVRDNHSLPGWLQRMQNLFDSALDQTR
jgi:glycosyltransferase involved in cell wall biosynthesis